MCPTPVRYRAVSHPMGYRVVPHPGVLPCCVPPRCVTVLCLTPVPYRAVPHPGALPCCAPPRCVTVLCPTPVHYRAVPRPGALPCSVPPRCVTVPCPTPWVTVLCPTPVRYSTYCTNPELSDLYGHMSGRIAEKPLTLSMGPTCLKHIEYYSSISAKELYKSD
ncbi:hypothetical protein chiPu_0021146 [Chiloscyllium punctatum]|uniref:Uncharacterized protein n=1 Tax=Chiloscyllium punctatum TaxID=137246 RepID=A0A401RNQ8_CHIPU|nr:hypothetical protein [Chiloscyllium punctatum]